MVKKIYILVLLACVCTGLLSFFASGIHHIGTSYQLDYGEGMCWWQSVHITDYTLAYKPLDQYPYMVVHYPPLYHLAARQAAALSGNWIEAARLISLAATAGIALAIGAIIFAALPRRTSFWHRLAAVLFGIAIPYPLDSLRFAWIARVDMLALFLTFATLAVFVIFWDSLPAQAIAVMLSVAACFTKQTSYTALLTLLLLVLLVRPRRALALGAMAMISAGLLVGYMSLVTRGGFLLNTFVYNINPFSLRQMMIQLQLHFSKAVPLVAFAAGETAALCAYLLRHGFGQATRRVRSALMHSPSHRALIVLAVHLFFAAAQLPSLGKQGAYLNYFIVFDLTCGALAGFLLFRLLLSWRPGRVAAPAAVAAAAALCAILVPLPPEITEAAGSPAHRLADQRHRAAYAEALRLVKSTPGLVYSEDLRLLMDAGKEMPAEPAIVTTLARAGRWDETPFRRMFLERKFGLVVVYEDLSNPDRFTAGVRQAIEENYQPTRISDDFTVYRPRPGSAPSVTAQNR